MKNDPKKAGQFAGTYERHGRYSLAPVHTRFSAIQWFVFDEEREDELGCAPVVGQLPTREAALEKITEKSRTAVGG